MRHPSARRKSIPVVVYGGAVVAWAVRVIIASARAYDSPLIRRSVIIIGIRIAGRIIGGGIIITAIIRRHIRPFRTSNHESCNDACANCQQECSTAVHRFGFCYRFHQMFPFHLSSDPLFHFGAALCFAHGKRLRRMWFKPDPLVVSINLITPF
jgi:hypothetical protein